MVTIKKLRASTILETLVASVIILMVFSLVATIFFQTAPTKGVQIIKVQQILGQYVNETNTEQKFEDEERIYQNYVLKRQVVENIGKGVMINFFVYNNNELLASEQRILLTQ